MGKRKARPCPVYKLGVNCYPICYSQTHGGAVLGLGTGHTEAFQNFLGFVPLLAGCPLRFRFLCGPLFPLNMDCEAGFAF